MSKPGCLILLLAALLTADHAASAQTARRVLPGLAANIEDCPVTLSDVSFTLLEHAAGEYRFEIVQPEARVHNHTERKIKTVKLGFEFEHRRGGMHQAISAVHSLADGATAQATSSLSSMTNSPDDFVYLTARALAVEFEDGARWVLARAANPLPLGGCLSNGRGPLTFATCKAMASAYQAVLRVNHDGIAAYRLGVVKDTVASFAVRLGDWVDWPPDVRKGDQLAISAADEKTSLAPEQIFPTEIHSVPRRSGQVKNEQAGVALFVAEVKYADGRIWRQSLQREDLLWNY